MSANEENVVARRNARHRALGVALLALILTIAACQQDPRPASGTAPVIASFNASPSRLDPGESAMLSWSVAQAEQVVLLRDGILLAEITGREQFLVSPPSTTSYSLRATNRWGTATRSLTVIVDVDPVMVELSPEAITMAPGETHAFAAVVTGSDDGGIEWSATCGEVEGSGTTGIYTAPDVPTTCIVQARSTADPVVSASATVSVGE